MMNRTVSWASGFLLAAAAWTAACKVANPQRTILQQAALHDATIHGTVLKSELGQACNSTRRLLTLKVMKSFGPEAKPGDTVVVATASESSMCGVDYPVGTEVVIFASESQGCAQAPGPLSTSEGDFNIANPTKPQLDSLYQGGPTALRGAGSEAGSPGTAGRSPGEAYGSLGRTGSAGMTFLRPKAAGANRCQADGRVLAP